MWNLRHYYIYPHVLNLFEGESPSNRKKKGVKKQKRATCRAYQIHSRLAGLLVKEDTHQAVQQNHRWNDYERDERENCTATHAFWISRIVLFGAGMLCGPREIIRAASVILRSVFHHVFRFTNATAFEALEAVRHKWDMCKEIHSTIKGWASQSITACQNTTTQKKIRIICSHQQQKKDLDKTISGLHESEFPPFEHHRLILLVRFRTVWYEGRFFSPRRTNGMDHTKSKRKKTPEKERSLN